MDKWDEGYFAGHVILIGRWRDKKSISRLNCVHRISLRKRRPSKVDSYGRRGTGVGQVQCDQDQDGLDLLFSERHDLSFPRCRLRWSGEKNMETVGNFNLWSNASVLLWCFIFIFFTNLGPKFWHFKNNWGFDPMNRKIWQHLWDMLNCKVQDVPLSIPILATCFPFLPFLKRHPM